MPTTRNDGQSPLSGSLVSGGYRLHYRVEGAGPPALIVGDTQLNRRVMPHELRTALRIAYVDHRGTAAEYPPPAEGDFALARVVDDIELLRVELNLPHFIIMGWSGQAFMALEYAKKYPARVSHVVMICTAPYFGPATFASGQVHFEATASAQRKAALERNRERWPDAMFEGLPIDEAVLLGLRRNAPLTWHDPDFDPGELLQGIRSNPAAMQSLWGEQFASIDISRNLERVRMPVFLALGRHDYNFPEPPGLWSSLAPRFADLTIRVFEKSGHQPHVEESAEFSRQLLDWISAHR